MQILSLFTRKLFNTPLVVAEQHHSYIQGVKVQITKMSEQKIRNQSVISDGSSVEGCLSRDIVYGKGVCVDTFGRGNCTDKVASMHLEGDTLTMVTMNKSVYEIKKI